MAREQRYLKHFKYVSAPISSQGRPNTTDSSFIQTDGNDNVTMISFRKRKKKKKEARHVVKCL